MYLFSVKDCYAQGLLKPAAPRRDFAKKSVAQAYSFLEKADKLISSEIKDIKELVVIALYEVFFHAARALLHKDGVNERSHACVFLYVKSKYSKLINTDLLQLADSVRVLRNDIQYSLDPIQIDVDLVELYNKCEMFIRQVEKLVE